MYFNLAKAPDELLERLREVDPQADLICIGQGWWLLGVHGPNPVARKVLADELEADPHGTHVRKEEREFHFTDRGLAQPTAATRLQLLQLYAHGQGPGSPGFRPIELYKTDRPDASIVADFRERHHNWMTRPDAAWEETKDRASAESGDRRRMATFVDYIESEAARWWHKTMKGARSFLQRRHFPNGG